MSKKKIYNKHFDKGKFYLHSDKKGGHPAYLYKKRDKNNEYYLVLFSSSNGSGRKRLRHSIEPRKVKTSYVRSFPVVSKRRDLGKNVLNRLKIHKEDKPLIKVIERKK